MIARVPKPCGAGHSDVVTRDLRQPEELLQDADALRQVVQARDAEIRMLRLVVQKLKLQLVRRNRIIFGSAQARLRSES